MWYPVFPRQYFSLRYLGPLLGRRRAAPDSLEEFQNVFDLLRIGAAHKETLYFLAGHKSHIALSIGQSVISASAALWPPSSGAASATTPPVRPLALRLAQGGLTTSGSKSVDDLPGLPTYKSQLYITTSH
jgi:hypothetical protein